ncbi:MAG: hypothetical protein K1X78_03605 [Verrucomicrobiaceae bacterium]|nr:hypothetical protein [Verrucomicrobiaceae bacterium]
MTTQQTALEHLRVIRSLLEKSQVYRAISAPAALCGGVLALIASAITFLTAGAMGARGFLTEWVGILAVTSAVNMFMLHREARSRSQPFFSENSRLALALRAFTPPMLVGGLLGVFLIWFRGELALAALLWILCYGLALLATEHFSPRSLVRLGRAFLVVGGFFAVIYFTQPDLAAGGKGAAVASIFLGTTFGLLHVAYAVAVFVRTPAPQIAET